MDQFLTLALAFFNTVLIPNLVYWAGNSMRYTLNSERHRWNMLRYQIFFTCNMILLPLAGFNTIKELAVSFMSDL